MGLSANDINSAFTSRGLTVPFSKPALEALAGYLTAHEPNVRFVDVAEGWSEFTLGELRDAYSALSGDENMAQTAAVLGRRFAVVRVPGDKTLMLKARPY